MRVTYIANAGELGGGNRSLLTLWSALTSHDVQPCALIPREGGMTEATRQAGYEFRVASEPTISLQRPWATLCDLRRTFALLKELSPDILHANDVLTARQYAFVAWQLGIPVVCHCRWAHGEQLLRWVLRGVPKPKLVIFVSHHMREQVGSVLRGVWPATRQAVVHNAVVLDDFQPRTLPLDAPTRIGMLANLIPIKGHMEFLEMAKSLLETYPHLKFPMFGAELNADGYEAKLRARVGELGIADAVEFRGHVRAPAEALAELSILCVPSHEEPFGRSVIEGMACEVPVIGSRVGGIPEIIQDGKTGLLFEPRSASSLTAAVRQLLEDGALRARIAIAGREHAIKEFSSQRHAERIVEQYRSVLAFA